MGKNSLKPLVILYVAPRTHYFSSNSKILQIGHYGAISNYRKCEKWGILIIEWSKHDPGTLREAFKPIWLTLRDHG